MNAHYAETLRVQALAELAVLSIAQLKRHFRHAFQLTPQQVLTKIRIEAAMRALHCNDTVATIGLS